MAPAVHAAGRSSGLPAYAPGRLPSPSGPVRPCGAQGAPPAPDDPVAPLQSWDLATSEYGPGTRLVLFTAGCPLRCQYCGVPQTWHVQGGRPVSVRGVMGIVDRYRPLFELTGGGVTLSGGEPLLHPEFVSGVLGACRAEGVHSALDTAGSLGRRLDDDALAMVDLALLDLKAYHPDTYRRLTGGDVEPTLHLARRLARLGRPVHVRFVLVPGLTDDPAELAAMAGFVAALGTVERVDVVPFHRDGEPGWNAMGAAFPLAGRPGPTREALAAARSAFREHGLTVG